MFEIGLRLYNIHDIYKRAHIVSLCVYVCTFNLIYTQIKYIILCLSVLSIIY